ncbi:MAG: hypothetical protein E6G34_04145 [Actinobacteria bacterium]|nr:MAG: hypothetical protein E6G34_04145 [Actinomycetota bacterium]
MRNRARHRSTTIERLRLAIDCLPVATREAMLDGVRASERIIAGAYVDTEGGVCPMLAAHRRGTRTDFLSFAKSWDRFTRIKSGARAATRREVAILVAQLEDSIASASGLELDAAISEHRELRRRRLRKQRRASVADADPAGEISARRLRPALLRPFLGDKSASRPARRSDSPVASRG